jgi:hypothetical protein
LIVDSVEKVEGESEGDPSTLPLSTENGEENENEGTSPVPRDDWALDQRGVSGREVGGEVVMGEIRIKKSVVVPRRDERVGRNESDGYEDDPDPDPDPQHELLSSLARNNESLSGGTRVEMPSESMEMKGSESGGSGLGDEDELVILQAPHYHQPQKGEQEEKILLLALMDGYEKDVRPVRDASLPILIQVGITLTQIFDMVSHPHSSSDSTQLPLTFTIWNWMYEKYYKVCMLWF